MSARTFTAALALVLSVSVAAWAAGKKGGSEPANPDPNDPAVKGFVPGKAGPYEYSGCHDACGEKMTACTAKCGPPTQTPAGYRNKRTKDAADRKKEQEEAMKKSSSKQSACSANCAKQSNLCFQGCK